jgi:hypothetical protein
MHAHIGSFVCCERSYIRFTVSADLNWPSTWPCDQPHAMDRVSPRILGALLNHLRTSSYDDLMLHGMFPRTLHATLAANLEGSSGGTALSIRLGCALSLVEMNDHILPTGPAIKLATELNNQGMLMLYLFDWPNALYIFLN